MQASDIMTRTVVSVTPDTTVSEVAATLIAHRISGVPVVDAKNRVLGIISEGDLYRRPELSTERPRRRWIEFFTSSASLARDFVHSHGSKAGDIMSRDVAHVSPETPVVEIAELFEQRQIKRVPVLDQGTLAGIVSRSNLVQALASSRSASGATPGNDRRIREDLMREYAKHSWGERLESNVIVVNGVVNLWGMVYSEAEADALRVVAEATPNVRSVVDHTTIDMAYVPPLISVA